MVTQAQISAIDRWLDGHGRVIAEEAASEGLPLDVACGLVEQESNGCNVFGCDHGDTGGRPPYCGEDVTKERVATLRAHALANGVGLTQLTYDPFVGLADDEGGAHLPRFQCRIGFRLLKQYFDLYPYEEALGAYNAGEGDRWLGISNGYAGELATKIGGWTPYVGSEAVESSDENADEHPTLWLYTDERGWEREWYTGKYIRTKEKSFEFASDGEGWQYVPGFEGLKKPAWSWPVANTPPKPNSPWYAERCPTRYSWPGNRNDIDAWARWLVDNYNVSVNTYHRHPEEVFLRTGVSREFDSYDVWGPGGRGDPLGPTLGDQLFSLVFNDLNPPNIEWIIYERVMYGAWNGWQGEPFGSEPFSWHDDHIHVTYR